MKSQSLTITGRSFYKFRALMDASLEKAVEKMLAAGVSEGTVSGQITMDDILANSEIVPDPDPEDELAKKMAEDGQKDAEEDPDEEEPAEDDPEASADDPDDE